MYSTAVSVTSAFRYSIVTFTFYRDLYSRSFVKQELTANGNNVPI